jgi:hypothetical protein
LSFRVGSGGVLYALAVKARRLRRQGRVTACFGVGVTLAGRDIEKCMW